MSVVIVSGEIYHQIRDDLSNEKKIAAIKKLRAAVRGPDDKPMGLREAKVAVERMLHDNFDKNYPGAAKEGAKIMAGPIISEIVCDFGDGPITVDVEEMQLKALTQLETIGLEACGRMLELCQVIKAFSEGRRVGILEEE